MSPASLRFPEREPFDRLRFVGIAICVTGEEQFHVGLLHRGTRDAPRLLELLWHLRLQNEPPPSEYVWLQLVLPDEVLQPLAAFCRLVWRRHEKGGLPYGFRFRDTRFDPAGTLQLGEEEHGLTCATFILAVFRGVGLELLDMSRWPVRAADEAFQRRMLARLALRAKESHVAEIASEEGCVRFRPEEVAGAATLQGWPVGFEEAERLGRQIASALCA